MVLAIIPAVSAEEDTRERVDVQFGYIQDSTTIPKITSNAKKTLKELFSATVEAESTSYADDQNRNASLIARYKDGTNVKLNGKNLYLMQAVTEGTVWNSAYESDIKPNVKGVWTIEVDMGFASGWYNLDIQGGKWHSGGRWDVYADHEKVGIFDCRDSVSSAYWSEQNIGNVYISPDSNGKIKLAFVLKEQAYSNADGTSFRSDEARVIIHKLSLSPIEAPQTETSDADINLTKDAMWFAAPAQAHVDKIDPVLRETMSGYANKDGENWITYGFEVVPEGCGNYESRYTSRVFNNIGLVTIGTGEGIWPNINSMFTIKKKISAGGYYSVKMNGIGWNMASDCAIYVNGEYAGDYNFYKDSSSYNPNGEKTLNTVCLKSGENEISFRIRALAADVTKGQFIPYYVKFVPASTPSVSAVESEIPEELAKGESSNLTARAKMADGSYRAFGYNIDGTIPADDNCIKVESSNPSVVEVSDVACVKNYTNSADNIEPETVSYRITAKSGGEATITVTSIVNGVSAEKTQKVTVPSSGEEEPGDAPSRVSYAVEIDGETPSVGSASIGQFVKLVAPDKENKMFKYWKNRSGAYISSNKEYTFTAITSAFFVAVYENIRPESDNTVTVNFFNANGVILDTKSVDKGIPFSAAREGVANPSITGGYTFSGWSVGDDEVIGRETNAVALFEETTGNVISGDIVIDGVSQSGKKFGEEIKVFADEGRKFSYWKKDGKVVSYDKNYSFFVWDAADIEAVYDEAVTPVPTIFLDARTVSGARMIEYNVPEGYTKIEAGIIFKGDAESLAVNSCYSKAVSQRSGAHGQFSAAPSNVDSGMETAVKGYLIYKEDGTDVYKVIYSE